MSCPHASWFFSRQRANLFIVPLDNERRWYRYHHLFGQVQRRTEAIARARELGLL